MDRLQMFSQIIKEHKDMLLSDPCCCSSVVGKRSIIEAICGYSVPSEVSVLPPKKAKNKGSGKRIKGFKEIVIEETIAISPLRLSSLQFHSSNCFFSIIEYTFCIMDNISDTNNRIDAIELNDDITGDVNALIDVELSSPIDVESIPVGTIRGATEDNSLIGVHASSSNAMDASSSIPGVAVEDSSSPNGVRLLIQDYPYAVDGLEIWSSIKTWVQDYCKIYYKSDDVVQKDTELQAWWKELREQGHGDLKDKPCLLEIGRCIVFSRACGGCFIWLLNIQGVGVNKFHLGDEGRPSNSTSFGCSAGFVVTMNAFCIADTAARKPSSLKIGSSSNNVEVSAGWEVDATFSISDILLKVFLIMSFPMFLLPTSAIAFPNLTIAAANIFISVDIFSTSVIAALSPTTGVVRSLVVVCCVRFGVVSVEGPVGVLNSSLITFCCGLLVVDFVAVLWTRLITLSTSSGVIPKLKLGPSAILVLYCSLLAIALSISSKAAINSGLFQNSSFSLVNSISGFVSSSPLVLFSILIFPRGNPSVRATSSSVMCSSFPSWTRREQLRASKLLSSHHASFPVGKGLPLLIVMDPADGCALSSSS
nr:probable linoleate 9S-lipoxygenase 5 [Ipomoea batatas]